MTFKDLQRLVQSQSGQECSLLLQRLRDKPFWIWDQSNHKQRDISTKGALLLGHCKLLLEQGYIAINPVFDKLVTSLRTAVAEENILDKESTSYSDIFDAFRLALKSHKFVTRNIEEEDIRKRNNLNQRNA
jgi:hypothetical protein